MYTTPNTNRNYPKNTQKYTKDSKKQNYVNFYSQKLPNTTQPIFRTRTSRGKMLQDSSLNLFKDTMPENYTNLTTNKIDVQSVITELDQTTLYLACQKFEEYLGNIIDILTKKFLTLECKIAQCQKHFNNISLELSTKAREIRIVKQQNQILLKSNREIQNKLNQLRNQYALSVKQQRNTQIREGIQQLRHQITKEKINSQIAQQNNRKKKKIYEQKTEDSLKDFLTVLSQEIKLRQQLKLSEKQFRIRQILHENLANLIQNVIQQNNKSVSQYAQQKILQNIQLKFELLFYENQLKTAVN